MQMHWASLRPNVKPNWLTLDSTQLVPNENMGLPASKPRSHFYLGPNLDLPCSNRTNPTLIDI